MTARRRRSAQEQADEFFAANRHFKVVAGSARVGVNGDARGVRYKLENGKWYTLGVEAVSLLPEFPRWRL